MARRGGTPGRVRQKLAEKIVALLAADGMRVRLDPDRIRAAEGFYRSDFRADCYRWEAWFDLAFDDGRGGVVWAKQSGASYSRMTDCLRGMTYARTGGWEWEFSAVKEPTAKERHKRLRNASDSVA